MSFTASASNATARLFRLASWPLIGAALVVLALQLVYLLSLASLDAIAPRDRIFQHLKTAFDQGVLADNGSPRPLIWRGGEQLTECISLGIGLEPGASRWHAAIAETYPVFNDTHACEGLHRAVTGAPTTWRPYFRYWHGYRVVLAPLAALLPLWSVKIINASAVFAACVLLWQALRKRGGETVATIFLITFVCLSDALFIWRTSTHSLSLAYILAGSALFAAALARQWKPGPLIVLAAVLGSGFNFIDFLINPPMMPMLIGFFILLSDRRYAGTVALGAIAGWFLGYAETWVAKWALAYLTMPDPQAVVADVLSSVENRTVGTFNGVYLVPLAATVRVFLRALSRVGVLVSLVTLVAIVQYARIVTRIDWRRTLWLSCPVLVCVLWFETLSSHTQFHLTVSSRSAAAACAVILTALILPMQSQPSLRDLWSQLGLLRAKLSLLNRKP